LLLDYYIVILHGTIHRTTNTISEHHTN
jgi:hypothetical protein